MSDKRSRYVRRSANLPRIGEDAELVLSSLSELCRRVSGR